jgi:NhaP-type Na+/H+ and K+/H+ antiporter
MLTKPTLLVAALLSVSGATALSQQTEGEAKLRETLRATMLQLRNAETERATLQAAQAALDARNKELTEQLDKLTKQAAANQADADKQMTELKAKVDERDREIGELRVWLDKWKADHQKITALAQKKEGERAKLADKVILLDRRVADQQTRNAAMYKLGVEVLDRYEKFGLGTALTAREPFVGLTRVKFENLIQDYSDKLTDERIKPEPAPASQPQAAAKKAPARKTAQ